MIMFTLLITISVIHGGICGILPSPPPFVETHRELLAALNTIQENVLSMADHIPLLNDSRRHFIEIVHVVYQGALEARQNCSVPDFNKILEEKSVEAFRKPKKVVENTQNFVNDMEASTKAVKNLIESVMITGLKGVAADSLINLFVKAEPQKYEKEVTLYLTAGKAAKKFNKKTDLFNKLSSELMTHKFVVTKFETLMDLIYLVSDVTKLLYLSPLC